MVSDGDGGAIVAWQDNREFFYDIRAQHVLGSGVLAPGWPADGLPVCTAQNLQEAPSISTDGIGGAIIAWQDNRRDPSAYGPEFDIYAQRVSGSGSTYWTHDGVPLCRAPNYQFNTQTVSDGNQGALVAWLDDRASGYTFNGRPHLYAQHVAANGTIAPGWPIYGRAVCTDPSYRSYFSAASDDSGGIYIAWDDDRSASVDGFNDVFAVRLFGTASLAPGWIADGKRIATVPAPAIQFLGAIATFDFGSFVAVWVDDRGAGPELYAQEMTRSGDPAPGWPTDGRLVSAHPTFGERPNSVISDGMGGLVAAWTDYRGGDIDNGDIYAQGLPYTVPTAVRVSGFKVLAGSSGAALSWSAYLDFPGHFQILRSSSGKSGRYEQIEELIAEPSRTEYAHFDGHALSGETYFYKLTSQTASGESDTFGPVEVKIPVLSLALLPAAPNPVRTTTKLGFVLGRESEALLEIFDASGRRVSTVFRGHASAGRTDLVWATTSAAGSLLPGGVYFALLRSGGESRTEKILLLR